MLAIINFEHRQNYTVLYKYLDTTHASSGPAENTRAFRCVLAVVNFTHDARQKTNREKSSKSHLFSLVRGGKKDLRARFIWVGGYWVGKFSRLHIARLRKIRSGDCVLFASYISFKVGGLLVFMGWLWTDDLGCHYIIDVIDRFERTPILWTINVDKRFRWK